MHIITHVHSLEWRHATAAGAGSAWQAHERARVRRVCKNTEAVIIIVQAITSHYRNALHFRYGLCICQLELFVKYYHT